MTNATNPFTLLIFMHKDGYCVPHPASFHMNLRDFVNHLSLNRSVMKRLETEQTDERKRAKIDPDLSEIMGSFVKVRRTSVTPGFLDFRRPQGGWLMWSYFMQTNHFLMYSGTIHANKAPLFICGEKDSLSIDHFNAKRSRFNWLDSVTTSFCWQRFLILLHIWIFSRGHKDFIMFPVVHL